MTVVGSSASGSGRSTQAPSSANNSAAPSPSTTASTARSRVQLPGGSPLVPLVSTEIWIRRGLPNARPASIAAPASSVWTCTE